MSYQVTITRGDADSGDGLISCEEWLAYVSREPELTVENVDGEFPIVIFKGKNVEAQLFWEDGAIWTPSPEEDVITKMTAIADSLKARVFGEDGTLFESIGEGYLEVSPGDVEEWDNTEVPDVTSIEAEEAAKPWWKKWFWIIWPGFTKK